jgi:dolichol-phosphate mannosyltransferase
MTYYFLIPFLNEENNLGFLIQNLRKGLSTRRLFFVFVNDGSTDNSVSVIEKNLSGLDFIILGGKQNHGPGYAFNTGFEWILNHSKNESDKIITCEADNTSDTNILEKMVAISELGYSLVLASVYVQGGGFSKTSFIRKLMSSIANLLFRFIFNIQAQTLSSFYRVYHIKLLHDVKSRFTTIINEPGFICMLEILIKAIHCNAQIIEVPMMLDSSRRKGKSKMRMMKTSLSYFKFILMFNKKK